MELISRTHVAKVGNKKHTSRYLLLPSGVADDLGWTYGTPINIYRDGDKIVYTKGVGQ